MTEVRRSFLKKLGLASTGLSLSWGTLQAESKNTNAQNPYAEVLIKGKVSSAGKGIADVVVTDGFTCTTTDERGNYELASNKKAQFVYLSTPAGYEFEHEEGIAKFYQAIKHDKSDFEADFQLSALPMDDNRHAFILWADTQMISEADSEELLKTAAPDAQQLVQTLKTEMPVHGIGCGDLVWDKFELFDDYKKAVAMTGAPFFQVIGNHDMDLDARTDDYSAATFKSLFGPNYYSFNRGKIHYVVLDDVFFIGTAKKYIGYITENQLAWLEQDLSHIKPGSTIVLSLHIPTITGAPERNELKEASLGGMVANRAQLYAMLEPYKVHIMSGHTHFNENYLVSDNIMEHVHGTVCGAWWTGPICYDGTPNGYGVYEANGDDISWYYKSTGHDKSHQMRIYPVGASEDKPDSLLVNIWNWDPEWEVVWMEDGVERGAMERITAYDPLSLDMHLGAEKPERHGWIEPQLTDHIFSAKPSTTARTVNVRVRDRFGNVYSEDITLNT